MYKPNLSARALRVIEQHLQEARFLHVSRMLEGTKLESALISALVERWRANTHAFHLSCSESIITLEDIALQLGLLVDGAIVMRIVDVGNWSTICDQLFGKVPNKFSGSQI
ncbi:hypothetical protein PVK06_034586 [Gossypium arboreum]|uniref:Aminotransferase-like plant mobile domain-containing protein n=1 Tax=Gossypium arboreum TaxID=29729 RepID=A0ABR0NEN5_GOSAR|nr:hypothetical protein PVK06_034586 [Gossypium arboreum]